MTQKKFRSWGFDWERVRAGWYRATLADGRTVHVMRDRRFKRWECFVNRRPYMVERASDLCSGTTEHARLDDAFEELRRYLDGEKSRQV